MEIRAFGRLARGLAASSCFLSPAVVSAQGVGWSVTNPGGGDFAAYATGPDVRPLVGDFNGDGRDDLALLRQSAGWTTIPVAFATGSGWSSINPDVGDFAAYATGPDVRPLVGDFNGDGRDDLALLRQSAGWTTIPVAFATGSGWSSINPDGGDFAAYATGPDVRPLVGDFNGDGRDDIALLRQSAGWTTIPVAFATGSAVEQHRPRRRRLRRLCHRS